MDLLQNFWEWIEATPEQFAIDSLSLKDPFEYPLYCELIAEAKLIVDNNIQTVSNLDRLLTIMAIDNEAEDILDYVERYAANELVVKTIEMGIKHIQPEARWQIAELAYRRRPSNCIIYLKELSVDDNPYVKKRATNCLEQIIKGIS